MGVINTIGVALGGVIDRVFARERNERAALVEKMEALYRGAQYEATRASQPWTRLPVGDRTPLRFQRPSVQYDLPELLVNRPTSLLFGEGRTPKVTLQSHDGSDTEEVNQWLASIAEESSLWFRFLIASRLAAIGGACAITWCLAAGEGDEGGVFEVEAHRSADCTPTFDPRRHAKLTLLRKQYRFARDEVVIESGERRTVRASFWHREEWDAQEHRVWEPARDVPGKEPAWGTPSVAVHGFGFVPAAWVRLEDGLCNDPFGVSHLAGCADLVEDIDRVLTQKSRAIFFNQDPERLYFGLSEQQRATLVGGQGQRFLPSKNAGADASVVEYSGEGQRVAEEHVQAQAKRVLETKRVVSPDPDKLLAAARSGSALEALNAPMLELVGEWRVPFGNAVKEICGQWVRAARSGALARLGTLETPLPAVIPAGRISLQWGAAFPLTPEDLASIANTSATLLDAGLCDRNTLVKWLSVRFGWGDVEEILEALDGEEEQKAKRVDKLTGAIAGKSTEDDDASEDDAQEMGTEVEDKPDSADAKPETPDASMPSTDTKSPPPPKVAGAPAGEAKVFSYHLDLGILTVNQVLATIGQPPIDDGDLFLTEWQEKHRAGPFAPKAETPPASDNGTA